ncbi:MAG TPA: IPTL-CTERM sorting domain-containing protein, partial [Thermoanaerobaculia bacterium]|nr:IPTL-CTERM sorting domain-containing protein [Thermoanaerobaculia bacterium]
TATVTGTGVLTNAAAVTADNADPVSANNTAAANLTVLQSALEIPTLGLLGLAALALLLAATAFALIARRRATR